jgi:hypothetical protein
MDVLPEAGPESRIPPEAGSGCREEHGGTGRTYTQPHVTPQTNIGSSKLHFFFYSFPLFKLYVPDIRTILHRIIPKICYYQRHILRDRRPGRTACPACWAMGSNELKKYTGSSGLTRAAKAGQKSLVLTNPPNQPRKDPVSYGLFESPFASVSTVSRSRPSLVSVTIPIKYLTL